MSVSKSIRNGFSGTKKIKLENISPIEEQKEIKEEKPKEDIKKEIEDQKQIEGTLDENIDKKEGTEQTEEKKEAEA